MEYNFQVFVVVVIVVLEKVGKHIEVIMQSISLQNMCILPHSYNLEWLTSMSGTCVSYWDLFLLSYWWFPLILLYSPFIF